MDVAGLPVAQLGGDIWACVHGAQLKHRVNSEREKKRDLICSLLFLGENPQSAEVLRKMSRAS